MFKALTWQWPNCGHFSHQKSLQTECVYGQHFVLLLLRDFGIEAQEQPTSLWWALGSLPLHHLFFWAPPLPRGLPTGYFVSGYFQSPSPSPSQGVRGRSHLQLYANSTRWTLHKRGFAVCPDFISTIRYVPRFHQYQFMALHHSCDKTNLSWSLHGKEWLHLSPSSSVNSSQELWCPGFPGGTSGQEPTCQCRRCNRCRFYPWVRKIHWRRA